MSATALMIWSQLTMGASWRIGVNRDETTGLITAGPFRWARNPIYSPMILAAIGLTVLVPTIGTLIGTFLLVAFVEWQVRAVEEPFLVQGHGPDYLLWSERTGRFVPAMGCISANLSI